MADETITAEAQVLLQMGLEMGVKTAKDSGAAIEPLVLAEVGGERTADRFIAPSLKEGLEDALFHARSLQLADRDCVVLVYDDYVELPEEGRVDAIWAEAHDAQGGCRVLVQGYKPKGGFKRFKTLGEPLDRPLSDAKLDRA